MIFNTSNVIVENNGGAQIPTYNLTTTGLLADYTFTPSSTSGQFDDSSGNNNHGVLGNGSGSNIPSYSDYVDRGVDFSGGHLITLPALTFSNAIAIELCYAIKEKTYQPTIIYMSSENDELMFIADSTSEGCKLESAYGDTLTKDGSASTHQWQYVQCVLSGSMKMYVNLIPTYNEASAPDFISYPPNTIQIGNRPEAGGYFKGSVALLRFYNKALTAGERKHNYLFSRDLLAKKGVIL